MSGFQPPVRGRPLGRSWESFANGTDHQEVKTLQRLASAQLNGLKRKERRISAGHELRRWLRDLSGTLACGASL